jgi:hypothetical protein
MPQQDSPAVKEVKTMLKGKRLARAELLKRIKDDRMLREKFKHSLCPREG